MEKQNQNFFGMVITSILPILLKSPYSHLLLSFVIILSLGYQLVNDTLIKQLEPPELAIAQIQSFTRAEYERLKIGMSLNDVETILGKGIEVNQSIRTRTFTWKNSNNFKIIAIFENNKLINKEQDKL